MARATHARCLHCGSRLPLYRKLTDAEFCSAAHRKAFQEDQTRLAMARLMETQKTCGRAGKPAVPAENIPLHREPVAEAAAAPPAETRELQAHRLGDLVLPKESPISTMLPAPAAGIFVLDPIAYDLGGDPCLPRVDAAGKTPGIGEPAGRTKIEVEARRPAMVRGGEIGQALPESMSPGPVLLPVNAGAVAPAFTVEQPNAVCRLPQIDALEDAGRRSRKPDAIPAALHTWLPLQNYDGGHRDSLPRTPRLASMRDLPRNASAADAPRQLIAGGPLDQDDSFIELPGLAAASLEAGVPPLSNQLAPNSVALLKPRARGEQVTRGLPEPAMAVRPAVATVIPSVGFPLRGPQPGRRENLLRTPLSRIIEPPPVWALRGSEWMPIQGQAALPRARKLETSAVPGELALAQKVAVPIGGKSKQSVIRAKAGMETMTPAGFAAAPAYPWIRQTPERVGGEVFARGFPRAAGLAAQASRAGNLLAMLNNAPLGVRIMAIMLPFLLAVALRAPVPRFGLGPVETAHASGPSFVSTKLSKVKTLIQNRAGIELLDDFRMGLDNWESRRDLTTTWSYDQTGFVRPGPLALYKPSMGLTDFDLEFLGQIDKKAIGWVYRAQNLDNYNVAKLALLKSGPLPTIGLVRYSVVNGKETPHKTETLPIAVHTDTIFRVRMETRGADHAVYLQNQLAGFWTDDRFQSGGVGFFSGRGEQSRIRWVQVSHQYDAIGRLCAYFAPFAMASYNLQPTIDLQSTMGAGTK